MHYEPEALRTQAAKDAQRAITAPESSEYPRRARSVNNALATAKNKLADVIEQTEESISIVGNDRESRRERRIARLMRKAAKADLDAAEYDARSHAIGEHIPFGQPILVGHHSEGRHRATIKRQQRLWDKWHESYNRAKELRAKAKAAEANNAIYLNDPTAREQIEEKIKDIERRRDYGKKLNASYRKHKEDLDKVKAELGFGETLYWGFRRSRESWYMSSGWRPFMSYEFSNMGAEIRRLKKRLEELSQREGRQGIGRPERSIGEVRIKYNAEFDKIELHFPGKPEPDVIKCVKEYGFRWIRTAGCWSRSANAMTEYAIGKIAEKLGEPVTTV